MALRLAPQPIADLDDIWDYIFSESGSEASADRAIDTIEVRFTTLSDWPRIGRQRDDLRRGYRSYPAGDYVIFYRIDGPDVVIQRMLHGRRDLRRLLDP
jgi:toxin ParE1/3/4